MEDLAEQKRNSMYTEKEVDERIKETLKKHLEPYEDCRRLVFWSTTIFGCE